MPKSKREMLMEAALDLFSERGFKATGIESILSRAGTAKMTLYKHFSSKDELVLAVLRKQDEILRKNLLKAAEGIASDPLKQILALFDSLEVSLGKKFNGCLFNKASIEYRNDNPAIIRFTIEHKFLIQEFVLERLHKLEIRDDEVSHQIMILFDGCMARSQALSCKKPISYAKGIAEQILMLKLRS